MVNIFTTIFKIYVYKNIFYVGGAAFPGISDLLHNLDELQDDQLEQRLKEIKKHLSDIMIKLKQASSWLSSDDAQL